MNGRDWLQALGCAVVVVYLALEAMRGLILAAGGAR